MYELVKQCVKNVKNELNQLPQNADALNFRRKLHDSQIIIRGKKSCIRKCFEILLIL